MDGDPAIKYAVLGTVAAESGADRRAVVGRQRLLLAQLLVERSRVVPTDRLVHTLWGDDLPHDPGAALRSQITRLRRVLPAPSDLLTVQGGYRLDVSRAEFDATRFEDLVEAAEGADGPTAVLLLEEALALWQGPAFGPVADRDFVQAEAARLDELRLTATEQRGHRMLDTGDMAGTVAGLAPLVHEHPEREHARALLMEALYREGRHTDALELYQARRDQLAERGLEPALELRQLEHRILTHQFPPSEAKRRRAALPRPVTSLIGREPEIRRVIGLVTDTRLVTLCGPGGVGKTRLALEAAARLAPHGPEAHHYCDLAAVGHDNHVIRAVAMAIGAERHDRRPRDEQLLAHLGDEPVLLVLDNCEHVADATARLAERLLRHTSGVRLLATSREPLGVDGETIVQVAPLAVGNDSPALELFLDRARAVDPDGALGADDIVHAATVCARVDGLPLALELAASRLRMMSTRELATALGHGFDLLDGGPRASPRHRSLRSVIEWSHQQLDQRAQQLFEALSVFAGPFDLEAAAAVAAPAGGSASESAGAIARLVDCSLLSVHRGDDDTTTYRMLAALRSYAGERLDARGSPEDVRSRHGAWAIGVAEAAAVRLRGADEAVWVRRVHRHFDDLRLAHEWLVGHDIEGALRLSAALHPFAMWRGHGEVFDWAEIAVAAAGGRRPPSLVAALGSVAMGRAIRGELDGAEAAAQAAFRASSEPSGAWVARQALAEVKLLRGEIDDAVDLYLHCHEDAMAAGDDPQAVWNLGSAALAQLYGGRPCDAVEPAEETAREAQHSQNPSAMAFADFVVGEIAAATDDDAVAEAHLRSAIALACTCDSRFVEGLARVTLATLQARVSDVAHALDHYASVIRQWGRHNTWAPTWVALRHLVDLLARHGAATEAAILYGAVTSRRTGAQPFGSDAALLEEAHERVVAEIGDAALSRHARQGSTLSGDDIIATALHALDAVRTSLAPSPAP